MSIAWAFNVVIWVIGFITAVYLVVCFIHIATTHRYQRGWDRISRHYPEPPVKPVHDNRSSIAQFRRIHKP